MINHLLVAFIVAWYLLLKWRKRHLTRVAAQLKSSMICLPVIGHLYVLLGNAEATMKGMQRMFRDAINCGGTVAHWYTNKLYITVADPKVADIILKNCLDKDDLMNFFHEVTGDGSIFSSVKKWRPRRKIVVPTFSMKNLTRFVEVFATQSSILADKLENLAGQDPSPMWKLVSSYAMDAVCETTLGFATKAQENDHPSKIALASSLHIVSKRIVTPWLHSDMIFERTSLHRILTNCKALGDNFIDEIIKSKRNNHEQIKNPERLERIRNRRRLRNQLDISHIPDLEFLGNYLKSFARR